MSDSEARLLVCYISGLDQRRLGAATTPFLSERMTRCPWQPFTNLPSNELYPTLVTGVDPTVHGVWGARLEPIPRASPLSGLIDRLPDGLTTAAQGLLHALPGVFDLAAVPPRRRRRLRITRTKYKRRSGRSEALHEIGGVPSVFSVVGRENCRYTFSSALDPSRKVLGRFGSARYTLEVLELYSLDRYQQWNLDRPEAVLAYYGVIDGFLSALAERCAAAGTSLMIVSDHGHEPIRESVDLVEGLRGLGVPEAEYTYFLEVSNVRFWFHTERARRDITDYLSGLGGTMLGYSEMARCGVPLTDDAYGELFLYLDPGCIFFPHDFHQPLANALLGLFDPMQRSRLRNPRHKGNHGHLPHFDAENAFIALLREDYETTGDSMSILDVAPSILGVLGLEAPATMSGRAVFRPIGGP